MKVVFVTPEKVMATMWENIKFGEAVQSVSNPANIIFKIGPDVGMRLKATSATEAVGTAQYPGPTSKWYVCEAELTVKPVMGI